MNKRARMAILFLIPPLIIIGAGIAWAGSSDHADVSWQVHSGGGAPAISGSGRLALQGSLAQTAIGSAAGGDYGLGAGYWYGLGHWAYQIYLPLLLRDH